MTFLALQGVDIDATKKNGATPLFIGDEKINII